MAQAPTAAAAVVCVGVFITVGAAGVWPHSFAVGAAKSLALMMQVRGIYAG